MSDTPVIMRQVGTPIVLYDWSEQRCRDSFIPDAPARAFRRADNKISLIASHYDNWSLVGDNIKDVQPTCKPILSSEEDRVGRGEKPPARRWIEATFTQDGRHVAALLSESMTAQIRSKGCSTQNRTGECWLNDIVAAHSHDMGETFTLDKGHRRLVASLGEDYPIGLKRRYGVFTTTNIVERDGWYYSMMSVAALSRQDSGVCIFRTRDPFQSGSWRGWDGADFVVQMVTREGSARCKPLRSLAGVTVRSISYLRDSKRWIAIFSARRKKNTNSAGGPGFYYSTSPDLLNWSEAINFISAPIAPRRDKSTEYWAYPSLIDFDSKSRNFDTIDTPNTAVFFTIHHLKDGNGTMDRDLAYVPVSISNN